jgi:hypothetical protein
MAENTTPDEHDPLVEPEKNNISAEHDAPSGDAPADESTPTGSSGRLLGGFVAIVGVLLLGVLGWNLFGVKGGENGGVAAAANPATAPVSQAALGDAQQLLADTMKRYAAMNTFQAEYTWRLTSAPSDHVHGQSNTPNGDARA